MSVSQSLSFVHQDKQVNFWNPARSGNYESDCAQGRKYAEELLNLLAIDNNATIFGSIVRAIAKNGVYEGVEIGFCNRIGFELCGFIGGR